MSTPTQAPAAADPYALPDGAWGRELTIDLAGCDPAMIRDQTALAEWARHLVDEIGMTPYGQPIIQTFGDGALYGHTVIQLITTSSIMVHAVHETLTAYVNVFSCRDFDVASAVNFTVRAFGARAHTLHDQLRAAPPLDS
jgi:S-adenosylmethionine/arginine decarboxylase-like enzyme